MIIIFVDFLLLSRELQWVVEKKESKKLKTKDEEWTVKKPKAIEKRSHVCILHNTSLADIGTSVWMEPLQECKAGATKA